jgi:hypothetical protein
LRFKEQVHFKFKNKISAIPWKRKTLRLIELYTFASFCWKLSLNPEKQKSLRKRARERLTKFTISEEP